MHLCFVDKIEFVFIDESPLNVMWYRDNYNNKSRQLCRYGNVVSVSIKSALNLSRCIA